MGDGEATVVQYQAIPVSRPFEIVKQQLLELDEQWLEDALRVATAGAQAAGESGPGVRTAVKVRVRLGRCYVGRGVVTLAMEWEVTGSPLPSALTGDLEVLRVGPAEARMGVRIAARPESLPDQDSERAAIHQAVDAAIRLFLAHLNRTLDRSSGTTVPVRR